jgi:hypothetical protein
VLSPFLGRLEKYEGGGGGSGREEGGAEYQTLDFQF